MEGFHQSMNEPRRPREDIPNDYICKEPYCGAGPFKNEHAYLGHMVGKHRIKYELKNPELSKRLKAIVPSKNLKPWHKYAFAKHIMYGISLEQIAKDLGKNSTTLRDIAKTPAGEAYLEELDSQTDAVAMVRNMLQADSVNKYIDWQLAFGWAMENRDYDAVHRMVKDLGLKGIIGDESGQVPTQITVNLSGTDLAAGGGSVSHEIIIEAQEWDETEDLG